jgi:molecular chaperone GrpE (heat shock protein)
MNYRLISLLCTAVLLAAAVSCSGPDATEAAEKVREATATISGRPEPEPLYETPAGRTGRQAPAPEKAGVTPPTPQEAPVQETPSAEARPAPLPRQKANAPEPVVPFGGAGPALTETLNNTMELLEEARAENERLKETISDLRIDLQEKENTIQNLRAKAEAGDTRIAETEKALEQWKADVLGFRDEIRQAEEAELQVLQEILTVLKGFKAEKESE